MTYDFHNKVVLVTGGRGKIGNAIIKQFVADGATVIATSRKKTAGSHGVVFQKIDVTIDKDMNKLFHFIKRKFGRIDILVNNAAADIDKPICDTTKNELIELLEVNLISYYELIKRVIPLMRKGSRIINVSSILGIRGYKNASAYCATKGGVNSLTRALAVELGPKITVNTVSLANVPGKLTPLGTIYKRISYLEENYTNWETPRKKIPMGRRGNYEEYAAAILFLASDKASYITGINLLVDGGVSSTF